MIRVCRRLGGPKSVCRVLSGQRYPEVSREQGVDWVIEAIEKLLPVARECDVVLGMENHYKDGFWKYPEFAQKKDVFLEIVNAISDRELFRRAIRSVATPSSPATIPSNCLRDVADRVVSMHASDRYLAAGDFAGRTAPERRHARLFAESLSRRHGQGAKRLRRHLPHPGGSSLHGLGEHRGRHERHGRDGGVVGVPAQDEQEVLSGGRKCDEYARPSSAAARWAGFTPTPCEASRKPEFVAVCDSDAGAVARPSRDSTASAPSRTSALC